MGLADWFRQAFAADEFWTEQERPDRVTSAIVSGDRVFLHRPMEPGVRLAAVRAAPSREEFAAWRDHPVTLFVFAALNEAQRAQREHWDAASWSDGIASQELLNELRVRADAYAAMEQGDYEAYCEWAGVDPQPEEE